MISETIHNIGIACMVACAFAALCFNARECSQTTDLQRTKFLTSCVQKAPPLECGTAWRGQ